MTKEYKRYCPQQSPDVSPVDKFKCDAQESICPKTRKNYKKCEILLDIQRADRMSELEEQTNQ